MTTPRTSAWRLGLILFGSGLAALVYQMAWTREFRLVFGASTAATAAVLAVFIGGLGAGGLLFGARADRMARPLALYASLELGAAVFAALSPLLLWGVRAIYVGVGGSARLGMFAGTGLRLVLGALVLGPPTLLMGGAMPAAVAAVEVDDDGGRRRLALLYGANTLGAVTGCLLATFALLEALGTRRTLWLAAALGACVATTALIWARKQAPPASPAAPVAGSGLAPAAPTRFVLGAAAAVGFAFFLMELVWYRMLGPLLGGTVFSFGIILAVALLGIGLGSLLYGIIERSGRPVTHVGLAVICLVESAAVAVPYALGDRLALLAVFLRPLGNAFGFPGQVMVWAGLAGVVVFPAALASGVQFPLLIGLLGRGRVDVGRHTGLAYAWNTLGAIAGSLAGGFGLLPALSAPGCWRLVAGMLIALALLALLLGRPAGLPRAKVSTTVALVLGSALVAVLLDLSGPTAVWRHSPIAVGRVDPAQLSTPVARHDWQNAVRRSIARDDEGIESSVALERSTGYAFVLNGKTDGHARLDAGTQVMGGLLGAFLHPGARRAFVIGLGTGSTSGWLAAVPSIERVDTVELEPAIANVARACAQVNRDVLDNPKHHLIIGDAREALLTGKGSYDLIASEPSNPYRAGIASLFTTEYYASALRRLSRDGIFLQWVQAYAIDARTFRTIVATLAGVFPEVEIWQMSPFDLLLVATRTPIHYQADELRARIQEQPFHSAFLAAWSTDSLTGVLSHHVANPSLARTIARAEGRAVNSDDKTVVEFGFARALGAQGALHARDVIVLAQAKGADQALTGEQAPDASALAEEREAFAVSLGMAAGPGNGSEQRERFTALNQWIAGDYPGVLAHWRAQPRGPATPVEALVLADALAVAGDAGALTLGESLRSVWPPVADGIAARFHLRHGNGTEAVRALEASLVAYRAEPWPPPTFMLRILGETVDAARIDPSATRRLLSVLEQPFAVHMMDEARALTRVALARLLPPGPECAEVLDYFEPWVPWQADLLSFRAACYEAQRPALAAGALEDLSQVLRESAASVSSGL